jgi:hypothetical protein
MSEELISRAYQFEIRADRADESEKGIITGRPIVYDQKTDISGIFAEIIDRGALDKTDLHDVRFMVNHDLSKIPLARSRKNTKNSTMQLTVDKDGMGIRVRLDTENNAEARALYSAIERGDISGMSFMFGINGEKWEDLDSDYPTRHITDISTVVEVSAVTFPAYEGTSIETAKRDRSALDNARRAVETARESGSVETEKELLKMKIRIMGGMENAQKNS